MGPLSSVAVAVTFKAFVGSVIVTLCSTAEQTVPSIVTLTVYTPAPNPFIVLEVTPLSICGGVVFHLNVKVAPGFAIEDALTVALPVLSPVHNTSTILSTVTMASHVFEQSITTPCVNSQPFASVTVTVCVPAGKLVAVMVV